MQAQLFENSDLNGDGQLSKEELATVFATMLQAKSASAGLNKATALHWEKL